MPLSSLISDAKDTVMAISGAAVVGMLTWFKLKRVTTNDAKATTADEATTGVINLLRSEIQRLADQNIKLAGLVNELQMQVIGLQRENAVLKLDVRRIQDVVQTGSSSD